MTERVADDAARVGLDVTLDLSWADLDILQHTAVNSLI